jgi:hypothetical protein
MARRTLPFAEEKSCACGRIAIDDSSDLYRLVDRTQECRDALEINRRERRKRRHAGRRPVSDDALNFCVRQRLDVSILRKRRCPSPAAGLAVARAAGFCEHVCSATCWIGGRLLRIGGDSEKKNQ